MRTIKYIVRKMNEPSQQAIYNFNKFIYELIMKELEEKHALEKTAQPKETKD